MQQAGRCGERNKLGEWKYTKSRRRENIAQEFKRTALLTMKEHLEERRFTAKNTATSDREKKGKSIYIRRFWSSKRLFSEPKIGNCVFTVYTCEWNQALLLAGTIPFHSGRKKVFKAWSHHIRQTAELPSSITWPKCVNTDSSYVSGTRNYFIFHARRRSRC